MDRSSRLMAQLLEPAIRTGRLMVRPRVGMARNRRLVCIAQCCWILLSFLILSRRKEGPMPTKTDRVQIDYCLKFTTLFHCGTGMRMGLVDRTVIRDSEDYLYVPGSTFKGVLRERCEQLARFYEDEAGKELVASPHDAEKALRGLGTRPPTMVTRIFGSHNVPGRLFFDDARLSEEDQKLYIRARDDEPGGERRVQDAGQKEESAQEAEQKKDRPANRLDYKGLQVDLYTQVRLDRLTRTSVEGALYTREFGTRDLTFNRFVMGWLACIVIAWLHNQR